MNDKKLTQSLYNLTPMKILSFFSLHPGEVFSAQEIAGGLCTSRGATHQSLQLLLKFNIISREAKGNMFLYMLNNDNVSIVHFRIFESLLRLQEITKQIKPFCSQVILFGSCAVGTNTGESDIDLFIKSENKTKVRKIINRYGCDMKINAVIQDALEMVEAEQADKEFYKQVKKGVILWEGMADYEEV